MWLFWAGRLVSEINYDDSGHNFIKISSNYGFDSCFFLQVELPPQNRYSFPNMYDSKKNPTKYLKKQKCSNS